MDYTCLEDRAFGLEHARSHRPLRDSSHGKKKESLGLTGRWDFRDSGASSNNHGNKVLNSRLLEISGVVP